MATIAKGMITLVNVNDAYSVSATPNVCAIKADFDGTNPVLDDAYCDITVVRGDVKVPFTIQSSAPSNDKIGYSITGTDATKRLTITSIPSDVLSGTITVEVATEDEFVATVIFQYSVMRESTMLDWIKDWENNKTTIGSTYLITPKIFVGKKVETEEDLSVLTGVYIGPDSENGAGIYGYKEGIEIFHINETGGSIGGWDISNGGIQTSDGLLKILSEGTIISSDKDGNCIWGLYKSGEAVFANGNVKFHTDGSAEFAGIIKSSEGEIGGWYIGSGILRSNMMCLDANNNYIGVSAYYSPKEDGWDSNSHKAWVAQYGGVAMYYLNKSYYGMVGYLPQTEVSGGEAQQHKVFSLGSINLIAGWNFDDVAIWIGEKLNTDQQYTTGSGSITIGTNGLRGHKWFIDSNGDISFMGGKIKFTASEDGGEIVGWKLNTNRLSTDHVALVSDGSVTGLYMTANASAQFNSWASSYLEDYIDSNGGIYMNINDTGAEFAAYNNEGKKLFKIKSDDISSIAGWNFDNDALYTGTKATSGFTTTGSITFGPAGIRGYKWRLENDGSGAIAGGNITWDTEGNVTFADVVTMMWSKGIDEANSRTQKLYLVSQQMAYGKMLYRDPEFTIEGFNSTNHYPASSIENRAWVSEETAPNGSQKIMQITATQWNAYNDYRLAGFHFANQSRANAKFAVRIVACIPKNWKIVNYHDAYGDGGTTEWLTSQDGTGNWEEYICLVTCGSTGTFSTINHFALTLSENGEYLLASSTNSETNLSILVDDTAAMVGRHITSVVWKVAYATVIDLLASDKLTTAIDINGIYTGTLRADNITSGTISTANIQNATGTWYLNQDGSGALANGNIIWDAEGNTNIKGLFSQDIVYIQDSDVVLISSDGNGYCTYKLNKDLYLLTQFWNSIEETEETDIPSSAWHTLILPSDKFYIGKEVRIYDSNFGPYSRTSASFVNTTIKAENDLIYGIPPIFADDIYTSDGWDSITVMGGYIEFVGLPDIQRDSNDNPYLCTKWICVRYSGMQVYGTKNETDYQLSHNFSDTAS